MMRRYIYDDEEKQQKEKEEEDWQQTVYGNNVTTIPHVNMPYPCAIDTATQHIVYLDILGLFAPLSLCYC